MVQALEKIPELEFSEILEYIRKRPIEVNKYRPSVGIGRSQTWGIVNRRCLPPDISRQSWRHPYLHKLLMDFAAKHVPVPFTSIQVNENLACAEHVDKGNVGQSFIVGFGDYEGGSLNVEGYSHNIQYRGFLFDGSKQKHKTEPFRGNRFTIVYHTLAGKSRWAGIVPEISEYEAVNDGVWKIKRLSDGELFWNNKGLDHPLKGRKKAPAPA